MTPEKTLPRHPAGVKTAAFRAALPYTLPICIGFLFLGMSYGFLMRSQGFSLWYPLFMSLFIFAGSMEFVTVNLLLTPTFQPLHAFLLAFLVNARHLFYGLSMLEKFKNLGWKKPYLIFGLCDETFAIHCAVTPRRRWTGGGSCSSSRCSTSATGWRGPPWAPCWGT